MIAWLHRVVWLSSLASKSVGAGQGYEEDEEKNKKAQVSRVGNRSVLD